MFCFWQFWFQSLPVYYEFDLFLVFGLPQVYILLICVNINTLYIFISTRGVAAIFVGSGHCLCLWVSEVREGHFFFVCVSRSVST